MLEPSPSLPAPSLLGTISELPSVRLTFASAAFLSLYRDLLNPLALTPGRMVALSFIESNPGCEQKALAIHLGVNEASAMAVLNRLEAAGLVERRRGRNKRSNAIYMTDNGELNFERALEIEKNLSAQLFQGMSNADLEVFVSNLDRIFANSKLRAAD